MQKVKNLSKLKNINKHTLILLYLEDCPWCHFVRTEVLEPMNELIEYTKKLNIQELEINAGEYIVNFNDKDTSANRFAFENNINFYPTILLFDNQGKVLEKIVGVANKDFYWSDLDKIFNKYNI